MMQGAKTWVAGSHWLFLSEKLGSRRRHWSFPRSALVISRITWMEVLIGAKGADQQQIREKFMRSLEIAELDEAIGRSAIEIRKQHKLKLPDAIIWATALKSGAMLLTRNTKDFPKGERSIRFPYRT